MNTLETSPKSWRMLSVGELKRRLEAGESLTLLDVRSQAEYRGGHLPGAKCLPLDRCDAEAARVVWAEAPGSALVLVCLSGRRAETAAGRLCKQGMDGVLLLEGGTQAWINAGFDVKREACVETSLLRRAMRLVGRTWNRGREARDGDCCGG